MAGVFQSGAVIHRQYNRVDARRIIGMEGFCPRLDRSAVSEVPEIGQGIAIGICRGVAVEGHRGFAREDVLARLGDRLTVDVNENLLLRLCVARAAVIHHGQGGGVDSRLFEGAFCCGCLSCPEAIAEIPLIGKGFAVRIVGPGPIEFDRLPGRGENVTPCDGDRGRVDEHGGHIVACGALMAGIVAHHEHRSVGAGVFIGVGYNLPTGGLAVTKVPQKLADFPIRVKRTGTIEGDLLARSAGEGRTGVRDGDAVDNNSHLISVGVI